MKYIDAEKLRSMLQNTINSMKEKDAKGERYDAFLNGKLSICEELLGCIDSLQQEQPEVDLEKFDKDVTEIWCRCAAEPNDSITCFHIETFNEVARHFYELGQRTKYQQDRAEFAELKAKEWQNGYDEGYMKGLNARKGE